MSTVPIFDQHYEVRAAAKTVAGHLIPHLNHREHVLWLVPGGSGIPVAVATAKLLASYPTNYLTVTLTDERYGPTGHQDSNWKQLLEAGFTLPEATVIPILQNLTLAETIARFSHILEEAFAQSHYTLGLFGIGTDGHTAGILPSSPAVQTPSLTFGYQTEQFTRLTITNQAIAKLDTAIAYAVGQEKWPVIRTLSEEISLNVQPAQALKSAKQLTVITDYKEHV